MFTSPTGDLSSFISTTKKMLYAGTQNVFNRQQLFA